MALCSLVHKYMPLWRGCTSHCSDTGILEGSPNQRFYLDIASHSQYLDMSKNERKCIINSICSCSRFNRHGLKSFSHSFMNSKKIFIYHINASSRYLAMLLSAISTCFRHSKTLAACRCQHWCRSDPWRLLAPISMPTSFLKMLFLLFEIFSSFLGNFHKDIDSSILAETPTIDSRREIHSICINVNSSSVNKTKKRKEHTIRLHIRDCKGPWLGEVKCFTRLYLNLGYKKRRSVVIPN